jgi:hypothetical protein
MAETGGLFVIDAETNDMSQWTSYTHPGSATMAASATAKNNGSYGFLFSANGSDLAYGGKTFSAVNDIYVRFYVYIPSGLNVGTGAGENLMFVDFNAVLSDEVRFGVITGAGGTPYQWVSRIAGTQYYSSTNYSADAWHYVEIRYLRGASLNGGAEVWVDGSKDASLSNITATMNVQATAFYLGPQYLTSAIGAGDSMWFDDIKADTAYVGAYSGGATDPITWAAHSHKRMIFT